MRLWTDIAHRLGLLRSILMYHAIPFRRRQLTRFYAQFIHSGDLCFDIGAHVGSRLQAWLPLGARIIAVEPQPQCMRLLRQWYGHHSRITLIEQAIGAKPGMAELFISPRTPTVTSLSLTWIEKIQSSHGFEQVRWEYAVSVPVITLDQLIAAHGLPAFCKIDVEGYELEVLKGLSQPIPALSFEYLTADLDTARRCIACLVALGNYQFNGSAGEAQRLLSTVWLDADQMLAWLDGRAQTGRSGDIYARLPAP